MKISPRALVILLFALVAGVSQSAFAACSASVDRTVVICSPASGATVASPMTLSAASKDLEHPVTAMKLYVDGVAKGSSTNSTSLNLSVPLTTGAHKLTVKAWDSSGFVFQTSESITVSTSTGGGGTGSCSSSVDRTVNICSPASGSTVASPVSVSAAAKDLEATVTAMKLYVDGVSQGSSTNASLTLSVPMAAGTHKLTVKAWDSSGFVFSTSESITVSGGSTSASLTISANPTSITSGQSSTLTVTASNATSVVVSNNQDSTTYTMSPSGGTVAVSPTVTTTYTATATGSNGVSATSSATVMVGAPSSGDLSALNHIVFMLQENRSFDSYFGMLNPYRAANGFSVGDDGTTYTVDGIDDKLSTISNLDDEGQAFKLFHTSSTCLDDMTSAWLESYGDVSRYNFTTSRNIGMDGFVHIAENFAKSGSGSGSFTDLTGERAMAYYRDTSTTGTPELNYYYYMASQFALSDRWFSPVASKTVPNRIATMSGGTTQGYVFDPGSNDHAPQLGAQTIFQLLDNHGVSWKIYYQHTDPDGSPSTSLKYFSYSSKYIHKDSVTGTWSWDTNHIAPSSQYYTDVSNGTLPNFAYIDGGFGDADEHPGSGQSILSGQQRVAKFVNALMYSPSWKDSAFFMAFDEGGGPYDHVPPIPGHTNKNTTASLAPAEGDVTPIANNPDGYLPCQPAVAGDYTNHCDLRPDSPGSHPADAAAVYGFAAQIGFRVPNIVVSPFVRKHYVGHAAMDHTAVLRLLERRFNLPALTARDAAQPDLLDFFDFAGKPWLTPPPQSSLPAPPSVGTTCHPATMQ